MSKTRDEMERSHPLSFVPMSEWENIFEAWEKEIGKAGSVSMNLTGLSVIKSHIELMDSTLKDDAD